MKANNAIWICPKCGSENIEEMIWIKVNTGETVGEPDGRIYCPDCDSNSYAELKNA